MKKMVALLLKPSLPIESTLTTTFILGQNIWIDRL